MEEPFHTPKAPYQPIGLGKNRDRPVWVKRLDQIHQELSGNKWYKLQFNLKLAKAQGAQYLLSFGGGHSNHLFALAAAARQGGFGSIGLVRGGYYPELTPTLAHCRNAGMQLHFLPKAEYRQKEQGTTYQELRHSLPHTYPLPEGGSNLLGVWGARQMLSPADEAFDQIFCPVGSGGSLAGLSLATQPHQKLSGVAVMKQGHYLKPGIEALAYRAQKLLGGGPFPAKFELLTAYHGGGFAKESAEIAVFGQEMAERYGLPLDRVYNKKTLFALDRLIQEKQIAPDAQVLYLHTGGLQNTLSC